MNSILIVSIVLKTTETQKFVPSFNEYNELETISKFETDVESFSKVLKWVIKNDFTIINETNISISFCIKRQLFEGLMNVDLTKHIKKTTSYFGEEVESTIWIPNKKLIIEEINPFIDFIELSTAV